MGLSRLRDIWSRFSGGGVYPHELAFLLDLPLRRLILSPEKLADRLHLKNDSHVLEIGPGSGYFSIEVARRIPNGILELIDIQEEMLEKIRVKGVKYKLKNLRFKAGDAASLPYEDNVFDVIFMVTVLAEIDNKEACLKNIYRILKSGGILSITEQPGDPDSIPFLKLKDLLEGYGFKYVEKYNQRLNYTANFTR